LAHADAAAHWPRDRSAGRSGRLRRGRGDDDPQAPVAAGLSGQGAGRGARRGPSRPLRSNSAVDFRSLPIVTIDGETARDFDDAVLVTERADGGYELQVHIADVAEYVRAGTDLDLEARLRGTSVYFPDRAIPMLPQELSTDICSLRPGEDRLVLSCIMQLDPMAASRATRSSRA
jgi:exoribonuclease II